MLNGKFIIKVSNVVDDEGDNLPPFYMGERHVDLSVLSHDIFEFEDYNSAFKHCDRDMLIENYKNAIFTIQKVTLVDVVE
jgi:hypothetical protein